MIAGRGIARPSCRSVALMLSERSSPRSRCALLDCRLALSLSRCIAQLQFSHQPRDGPRPQASGGFRGAVHFPSDLGKGAQLPVSRTDHLLVVRRQASDRLGQLRGVLLCHELAPWEAGFGGGAKLRSDQRAETIDWHLTRELPFGGSAIFSIRLLQPMLQDATQPRQQLLTARRLGIARSAAAPRRTSLARGPTAKPWPASPAAPGARRSGADSCGLPRGPRRVRGKNRSERRRASAKRSVCAARIGVPHGPSSRVRARRAPSSERRRRRRARFENEPPIWAGREREASISSGREEFFAIRDRSAEKRGIE